MKHYMLDTNIVSSLFKKNSNVAKHIIAVPITSLCISSITEGELLFGLTKHPNVKQLHSAVREFLLHIDVLAWDSVVAECYGHLRANMERKGKILAPLDMLIAAHAIEADAILVTNDKAFKQVAGLKIENWT